AVGHPAHSGWNQDRAEPLTGLAQSDNGTLLVTTYGRCLHRQDHRLDHPFKPTATDLKQEQQAENAAQQRCDRYQQNREDVSEGRPVPCMSATRRDSISLSCHARLSCTVQLRTNRQSGTLSAE